MTLVRGSKGSEVEAIQKELTTLGFNCGPCDGDYGARTFSAVRDFQQRYFVHGHCDNITMNALSSAAKVASKKIELGVNQYPVPNGLEEIKSVYGMFEYQNSQTDEGFIVITNNWESENMVYATFDIIGEVYVNKHIVEPLNTALVRLSELGFTNDIQEFYCFSPRYKLHDRLKGLSTHSWGIAFDINPSKNKIGTNGSLDPQLVSIFKECGFIWGGDWRTPKDPMHFQLASGY